MSDFGSKVQALAIRSKHASEHALTEEATKTAVIMPFIQALGFDLFDLNDVTPEFVADVGVKKGEKVDFALKIDGKPVILIEAKPISAALGSVQHSQLYRYFAVASVKVAILTNGRQLWFFSDTDEKNKMDKKPFFTFDFQNFDEKQVVELSRFQKHLFDIDAVLEAASDLKYVRLAAAFLKEQLTAPSDDFVRLIGKQIYQGSITKTALEQLRNVTRSALDEVIKDRIQDKLNIAFTQPTAQAVTKEAEPDVQEAASVPDIETTEEERFAFLIVQAIAARVIPVDRVTMRDAKSYCGIFVDDNNRKPVCRLYFNAKSVKHIGVFDANKNETRIQIQNIVDIYQHAALIEAAISAYR